MEKTTIAATMAVLVAILMVGAVLVPIIDIQSKETTTIINDGAGWARYDYYTDDSTDYDVDMSVASSTLTLGTQSGTASEMIVWASDIGSIICSGSDFILLYDDNGTDAYMDLGASAGVASASGTVTVTDSTDAAAATLTPAWAYVPAATGSFGFFDESGAIVKDFPVATAGTFAGNYTYNSLDSLNVGLESTATVENGAFVVGVWEIPETNTVLGAGYVAGSVTIPRYASVPTATYTDGEWGFNLSGSDAIVVSYSGSGGDVSVPSTVTDGTNTYTVTQLGIDSEDSPVFDNSSLATGSTLTLPSTLESINKGAVTRCNKFVGDLIIPDSVTIIGNSAFRECTHLTSLTLSDSLTSIGSMAFNGCNLFAGDLVLPSTLATIGNGAFQSCNFTGNLIIPDSVTSIGNIVFYKNSFDSITVLGSPTFGTSTLYGPNVTEVLNLGSSEIAAGNYGLPSTAEVRENVPSFGYMAPVSYSEITQKEGAEYDLMAIIPIMVIAGILMASAVMFGLMRRNY